MANYQILGSVELECEELMTTHEPIFTNERKKKLFSKAKDKKLESLNGYVQVTRCTPDTKKIKY